MGEVYLAEDTKLGRTVALKVLPEEVSHNQQRLARFAREARVASALNHPNVAHIYEIEVSSTPGFIAMEYINGETLRERLVSTRMTLHEAMDIAVQATRALAAAHAAGITHRDVKTENIMISRDGYVKVLDFGLAKLAEPAPDEPDPSALTVTSAHTDPGSIMGTVHYMSPEQARGLQTDARTDLWGLGVVLYEMISGALPFIGRTPSDVLSSILKDEPPPLARFNREVPEALEWIVTKALTKEVEGRYQTATELLTDLQRLKNRLGAEAEIERGSLDRASIERGSLAEFRASRGSSTSATRDRFDTGSAQHAAATNSVHPQPSSSDARGAVGRRRKIMFVALGLVAAVLVSAAALYMLRDRTRPARAQSSQSRPHRRITTEAGLQFGATWRPDGRMIAYSSNREGDFNIYFQSTEGGDPVRVTKSPENDWQPDCSPDGETLVFRSERDGGGIYTVPFTGGNERKIVSFGYSPQWSPDGKAILFLGPGQRVYDFPKLYYIRPGEEAPHEISTALGHGEEEGIKGGSVGWHPDGKRVSFLSTGGTFWTVPVAGGPAVKSEMAPEVAAGFKESGLTPGAFRWSPSGEFLYFEGTSNNIINLWRVTVDPQTLRWVGGPDSLTTDPGQDVQVTISRDGKRLAYTIMHQSTSIWLMPFDSASGQLKGQGQQATAQGVDSGFCDLSPDGKKLAYMTNTYSMNRRELRVKSLFDNQDKVLIADDYFRYYPRFSPDSQLIAYSRFRSPGQGSGRDAAPPQGAAKVGAIFLIDANDSDERPLTSQGEMLDYVYDWSPDGKWILASSNRRTPERWEICLFPVSAAPHAEAEMRVVASSAEDSLWTPRFSPDGKWIAYVAQKPTGASTSVLYVVPAEGGKPVRITAEDGWCDWPRWSSDGKAIYFVANYNSSFLSVWGVRFDPSKGEAAGQPFKVTSFESPARMISPRLTQMEMSLGKNRLALPLTDVSGSIWMLEKVDQ